MHLAIFSIQTLLTHIQKRLLRLMRICHSWRPLAKYEEAKIGLLEAFSVLNSNNKLCSLTEKVPLLTNTWEIYTPHHTCINLKLTLGNSIIISIWKHKIQYTYLVIFLSLIYYFQWTLSVPLFINLIVDIYYLSSSTLQLNIWTTRSWVINSSLF